MKRIIILYFLNLITFNVFSQLINPVKYEYIFTEINITTDGSIHTHDEFPEQIVSELNNQGAKGFELIRIADGPSVCISNCASTHPDQIRKLLTIRFYFKRATSFREEELAALINTINKKIDTVSRRLIDSSAAIINVNVLNFLKNIPNSVLTEAFRTAMTEAIIADVKKQYDAVIEELKGRIRKLEK